MEGEERGVQIAGLRFPRRRKREVAGGYTGRRWRMRGDMVSGFWNLWAE